jgi:hypothetical protein
MYPAVSNTGEIGSTPDDDCVLMAARTIAQVATSQLTPSIESIGNALVELFKLTQIVDFKFELAANLLDICSTKPVLAVGTQLHNLR